MSFLIDKVIDIDQKLLRGLAKRRTPSWTFLFSLVSYSGTGVVWFCLVTFLWILELTGFSFLPDSRLFLRSMMPAGLAWITGGVIKGMVKRPRPFEVMKDFNAMVKPPGHHDSFPSNHVATTSAFVFCLFCYSHVLAPVVLLWSLLIAISRLYLGVHYPSDVFCGALLGFSVGAGFYFFV